MPDVSYSYSVRVGPYTWTGDVGDPADYGPVDGLQIIRKLVDTQLWPAMVDTAECRFQLIVESTEDVESIELGTTVFVQITRPVGGSVRESFAGRVAELVTTPHDLGMLVTLSCLDYTADLRGVVVGAEPWPQEDVFTRVERVIELASPGVGVVMAQVPPGSLVFPTAIPDVMPRDVDAQDAWELVQGYLDVWPVDYGYPTTSTNYLGRARMNVVPLVDGTGELTGWQLAPSFEVPNYDGPLRLELVAGKWSAVAVDSGGVIGRVLPAEDVDVSASYAMTKADTVDRVTVSGVGALGPYVVSNSLGVNPPTNAEITDAELHSPFVALQVANMYLPGELPVSKWVADSFLWHMELAPAGFVMPELGALCTVGGIPTEQNPNQREWFTGQLSYLEFTLSNKRPTYAFQLRRPDFPVPNDGVATWNSSAIVTNPLTWANLNPRDTWDDYRLVRGSLL